jgi:organic hydroperoxide reductase OsmC/OhrA
LAGCFTTTFNDIAHAAKFDYVDLEVEIEGSVHRTRAAGCNFTEILIRPRLTVPSEGLRETGLSLLRRTKSVCMISRAITVPQTLEAVVEAVRVPVEGWANDDAVVKLGV